MLEATQPSQPSRLLLTQVALLLRSALIWDTTFEDRFADKDFAISVFEKHNETVKQTVPADQLLVYEVKEGWEPLCDFLDVEAPKGKPFPHLNDSDSFRKTV